jgi:hypothetical protein
MALVSVLVTMVLVSLGATLVLGALSYMALRARERRYPEAFAPPEKRFFVRYTLPEGGGAPPARPT